MQLYDAVSVNCTKGATTDIKEQVPSIWAKGYVYVGRLCVRNLTLGESPSSDFF